MKITDIITEAASPAQQAAIAISMKKAGKKPRSVDEDLTRRGFLRGLGAAAVAGVAGNALAGSNDPNFVRKVHDQHNAMMEKNPRYAKEHDALGIYIARGIVGASAENNKRWVEKTAELLQKYGVKVNEGVAEGSGESYMIIRTDAEGKKDVFAGNFDTYEQAQKELDDCLAHPLHTKYKQKFEIKRKGGEQGMAEEASPMIKPPANRFDNKQEAFDYAKEHGGKVFKSTYIDPNTGIKNIIFVVKKEQGVAEGLGNFAKAIDNLHGWYQDDSSDPNIERYEFDDREGGYYAYGTIEHNLKTGEIAVDFEDKSGEYDGDIKATFNSIGDAMNALRRITTQHRYNTGKAQSFDRLGDRTLAGPDDVYKTDRAGKKGTLTKSRMDTMKMSSPYRKTGPKGVLPEQGVAEEASPMIKPPANRFDNKQEAFAYAKEHGGKVFKSTYIDPNTGIKNIIFVVKKEQGVAEDTELAEEFDLIESIVEMIAEHNGVDAEVVWEDLESLTEDELYVFAVTSDPLMEDWQKANKQDKTDGMSQKAVNAYRRENPGSKLKTAVTTKPSKLKKGGKASKRRKSYCSRSRGQMKMHSISCAKTPDKAICKARRRWNC